LLFCFHFFHVLICFFFGCFECVPYGLTCFQQFYK
jgi:hypothetical protein